VFHQHVALSFHSGLAEDTGALGEKVLIDRSELRRGGAVSVTDRPNIVLILATTWGIRMSAVTAGDRDAEYRPAGLGRLRFSHFYNNAVCMPTRASVLTGLYPQQCGVGDAFRLRQTGNVTIAEVLKEAGYRTLISGKWHNGGAPGELPVARGFDRYWGLLSGCSNYWNPACLAAVILNLIQDPSLRARLRP